jgi:hypothetical protein
MLYWSRVYIQEEVTIPCPFTNINVIIAENLLKKWFAFLMPIKFPPVPNARARIPTRKSPQSFLLAFLFWERTVHLEAVAVHMAVLPEGDDTSPAVSRFFMKDGPNENSES